MGWGRTADGVMRHIDSVERGLACNCLCPDCGHSVVAKKGPKQVWHFAHHVNSECAGESVLHLAAKQVLLEAIAGGVVVLLPALEDELQIDDIALNPHGRSWRLASVPLDVDSGQDEVAVGEGLFADLVLESPAGRTVIVEIFVRHAKSEEDLRKFMALGVDAIEIDLSTLSWDIHAEALLDAVRHQAPRRWLFNGESERRKSAARGVLKPMVAESNQRLHQALYQLVLDSDLYSGRRLWDIEWPTLRESAYDKDASGKNVVGIHRETPTVTMIEKPLEAEGYCWRTVGRANGKTTVDVLFHCEGTDPAPFIGTRPTLSVECYPDTENALWDRREYMSLEWHNIDPWREKCRERARVDLEKQVRESALLQVNIDQFVSGFEAMSDAERLRSLATELGIAAPASPGKFHSAWNTRWAIWKSLVWKYKIQRQHWSEIQVKQIANDDWLKQLLGFDDDLSHEEQRSKSLWFWFRELESVGVLKHQGYQRFAIVTVPKSFVPWAKISDSRASSG